MSFPFQQQNFDPNYHLNYNPNYGQNYGSFAPPQPPSQGNYVPQQFQQFQQHQAHPTIPTQSNFQVVIPSVPQYAHESSSSGMPMMGYHQQSRVLQDVQPNAPRAQAQSKPQSQQSTGPEEVEYPVLLLALADEYLDAAYADPDGSEDYYKMIATALGCLESVLNNFKLAPIREAQVTLKYAQILLDETDSNDDAEKLLTRATDLCERNKLFDLKYACQSLLARVLHRSRPKAAIKDVQGMIEDVEVYHHVAWEYCFRLLHISLSLSSTSAHELHSAISQYEKIAAVARQNGDHAIYAFAAIMEALLHLQSNTAESVNSAQRALADARQLQLNPEVSQNPQMQVLMEFIDLCCILGESNLKEKEKEEKLKAMQHNLYQMLEKPGWNDSGIFLLPVSKRSLNGVAIQEGGLVSEKAGKHFLTMSWVLKSDIELLGFLLSAASVAHKNAADGGKAEKFIHEALDRLESFSSQDDTTAAPASESVTIWRKILQTHLLIEYTFLQCARGDWSQAQEGLEEVKKNADILGTSLRPELKCVIQYLNGVIYQGTGDTQTALAIFQSSNFPLSPAKLTLDSNQKRSGRPSSRHNDAQNEAIRDISLLAAMNVALITHSPTHPHHNYLVPILTTLEAAVHTSPNKDIQASYSLLLAILSDSSVLKQKQFLGNALSTAQGIGNAQVTALTLILMSEKFFKGVVGEQAVKCAKAASHQARRAGDPLWAAVAGSMEGECLEIQGRVEEARTVRERPRG